MKRKNPNLNTVSKGAYVAVPGRLIRAALAIAPVRDSRLYLVGVRVEVAGSLAVVLGTDGHVLAAGAWPAPLSEDFNAFIPRFMLAGFNLANEVTVTLDAERKLVVIGNGAETRSTPASWHPLEWRRAVPTDFDDSPVFLSGALLSKAHRAAQIYGDSFPAFRSDRRSNKTMFASDDAVVVCMGMNVSTEKLPKTPSWATAPKAAA